MKKSAHLSKNFSLSNSSIDEGSELIQTFLIQNGTPRTGITRCRLSAEESMLVWQAHLGVDASCRLECRRHLGKLSISLSVVGQRVDPYTQEEDDPDFGDDRNLLSRLGLSGSYVYNNGINELLLFPPGKVHNPFFAVALATMLAVLLGLSLSFLPQQTRTSISENIVSPFFSMLLNLLSTVAIPMIFLSVCSGIYNLGDMALLGRVGKKLVLRLTGTGFGVLLCTVLCTMWLFPVELSASSVGNPHALLDIYELLLSIVPENIVSPFIQGNALQVIFLGCAIGIGALMLGKKVSNLAEIVEQFHSIVSVLMSAISKVVPLFVFTCILDLFLSDSLVQFSGAGKLVLLFIIVTLLFLLLNVFAVCRKTKVPFVLLIKKLLPTFLVAFTTASSMAAFTESCESCKHKLGISEKLVNFGIPLSQVFYKPLTAECFLLSALCIGEMYGVTITPMWLITAVLVSGILSIAVPPVPGGDVSCFAILFLQLGIPALGVALAISVDLILDFLITATDLFCQQTALTLLACDIDMLDHKIIRTK